MTTTFNSLRRQDSYEIEKEACKISKGEVQVLSQKVLPPGLQQDGRFFCNKHLSPGHVKFLQRRRRRRCREETSALTLTKWLNEHEKLLIGCQRCTAQQWEGKKKKNKLETYPDLMEGGMGKKKEYYKITPLLLDIIGRNKSKDQHLIQADE